MRREGNAGQNLCSSVTVRTKEVFITTLSKKPAILIVAVFCLLGTETCIASAQNSTTQPSTAPSNAPPSPNGSSTSKRPAVKKRKTVQTASASRRLGRRRLRRNGVYGISSFGDPGAEDNPAGDDPAVRQAALAGLGNWNGSIVVVNPNDGRILSIVNQKLALSSGFTPCSTFKPVVALAALREGVITPATKLYVGNRQRMDLTEALARSNNVFFHKLGEMLGFQRLAQYAHEFSLGERTSDDIPGESPGRFPTSAPKEGGVGYLAYYGMDIEVTPLQWAAVISAIANGGTLYELQYPRTADELSQFQPKVRRRLDDLVQYFPEIKAGLEVQSFMEPPIRPTTPKCKFTEKPERAAKTERAGLVRFIRPGPAAEYVAVVLLRGGRMMFGPHAAEIAGHFYREVLHKERVTAQANQQLSTGR